MARNKTLAREQKTISAMITLFCRSYHQPPRNSLCPDCTDLLDYATQHLNKCPFGPQKPTCAQCAIHCYKPDMRERITQVMRYSGPRMLTRHPALAIAHLLKKAKSKPSD